MAGQDRFMNDFTPVQDATYIYAEDANGNQVKIKKSDLIALLKNNLSYIDTFSFTGDMNTIDKTGVYNIFNGASNGPSGKTVQGSILINMFWNMDTIKQMYFAYGVDEVFVRSKRGIYWSSWIKL